MGTRLVLSPMLDTLIIGGGFFGLYLAEHFALQGQSTLVCEQRPALMSRASYNNQARVHNGYHYPRSLLTACRSHANYSRFVQEFSECMDHSFKQVYAISRNLSKVSASQFHSFMRIVGSPIQRASAEIRKHFDDRFVEDVFETEECAFNSAKLCDHMRAHVNRSGATIRCETGVEQLVPCDDGSINAALATNGADREIVRARRVFNCTYSQINQIITSSGLEVIPLKYEMAELCLIRVPEPLRGIGVTVMCGPFFSYMPFPPRGLHTLSHVRYTPHYHWFEGDGGNRKTRWTADPKPEQTAFPYMLRNAREVSPLYGRLRIYRLTLGN